MDSILPIGTALGGGHDPTTGSYSKPLVLRVWYNPGGTDRSAHNASACGPQPLALAMQWTRNPHDGAAATWAPIPSAHLQPSLPPAEAARHALQASLGSGWSTWLHNGEQLRLGN